MFTGLVESIGTVRGITPLGESARYRIEIPFASELALGDSVAVNGCCLTVDRVEDGCVEFDLLVQTLRVTSLGRLKVGSICNLERAMGGSGRFGGHLVMGHVDATGEVVSVEEVGQDHRVRVRIPKELRRYTIDKGSISIDGISLTIASIIGEDVLEFWITPHTWQATNMRVYEPGTVVDVEVDMIAKYVENFFKGGAR